MDKVITDLATALNVDKYIVEGCYKIFKSNQKMIREAKLAPKLTLSDMEEYRHKEHIYLNQHKELPYNLSEYASRMIFLILSINDRLIN